MQRVALGPELADHLDVEAELFAQLLHGVQVAGVAAAEPGVVADHHVAGVQAVHQELLHKFLGGEAGKVQRVLDHQDRIQAQLPQGLQLVLPGP